MATVADLIAELQKAPPGAQVRVAVQSAKDSVRASLGDVRVAVQGEEVCLNGWAANTRMTVESNDVDDDEEEEDPNDLFTGDGA